MPSKSIASESFPPDAVSARIRLLLVDDHGLFREGLGRLLETEPDFELAGEIASVADAIAALDADPLVDLILLDFDLGDHTALDLLALLRTRQFTGSVLIVTAGLSSTETLTLTQLGVKGIFLKHHSPSDLVLAIRKVMSGESWFDPVPAGLAAAHPSSEPTPLPIAFTAREVDVLRSVFEGLTNKEIGSKMGISETYVKALLQQLFSKTGVRNRSQLVRVAIEKQLLRSLPTG